MGKLVDIAFVLGIGVLFGLSIGLTVLRELVVEAGSDLGPVGDAIEWGSGAFGIVLPILLEATVFTFLFRLAPGRRAPLRDLWPGVLVATLGYEAAKRGFTIYVENFGRYDAVYGSIGAIVVFLVFVYIAAMVMLLGAEYAAAWPRVRDRERLPEAGPERGPLREEIASFLKGLVVRTGDEEEGSGGDGGPRPQEEGLEPRSRG